MQDAVRTAVVNKRAGGTGPDLGPQGVPAAPSPRASSCCNAIQDVYLCDEVTIA